MSNPIKKVLKHEKNRWIYFQIGLIVALSATLFAFEWQSPFYQPEILSGTVVTIDEDFPMAIKEEKQEVKKQKKPELTNIEIVDDNIKTDDIDINVDINQGDKVPDMPIFDDFDNEKNVDDEIIHIPQFMPEFNGGTEALFKYLSDNIVYPQDAREMGIEGKVFLKFVIEKDGSVSNVTILRGVFESIDNEAVRVISGMPKWKPGKQGMKTVRVYYNIPIDFKLKN